MNEIDQETANYIIAHFSDLMNPDEKLALRHQRSLIKFDGDDFVRRKNLYYKYGWLSDDPEVLKLLNDGPDQFMINCAIRILRDSPGKVFLNLCPVCKKLARTPNAKQCRFCGNDWH